MSNKSKIYPSNIDKTQEQHYINTELSLVPQEFEWDEQKADANLSKHGISFSEAQTLWEDRNRVAFRLCHAGETRMGLLARYGGATWLAIYTCRDGRIRLISVRRAVGKEGSLYDKANARR